MRVLTRTCDSAAGSRPSSCAWPPSSPRSRWSRRSPWPPRRRPPATPVHPRRRQRPRDRDEPVRLLRLRAARLAATAGSSPTTTTGTRSAPIDSQPHACGCCWATGSASFAGARAAPATSSCDPASPTTVRRSRTGRSRCATVEGKKVGTSTAPLTATGPGPAQRSPGSGSVPRLARVPPERLGRRLHRQRRSASTTTCAGVISAEMPSTWAAEALEGPGGRGADVRDHHRRRRRVSTTSIPTPARRCTGASLPRRRRPMRRWPRRAARS